MSGHVITTSPLIGNKIVNLLICSSTIFGKGWENKQWHVEKLMDRAFFTKSVTILLDIVWCLRIFTKAKSQKLDLFPFSCVKWECSTWLRSLIHWSRLALYNCFNWVVKFSPFIWSRKQIQFRKLCVSKNQDIWQSPE